MRLDHLMILTGRLEAELKALQAHDPDGPLANINRWALFVTPTELGALIDELVATNSFEGVSAEDVQKLRDHVKPLHLHGVAIFPEFMEADEVPNG
jgi:hypothetical protein